MGLISEGTRISNLSIALLHNGFARRDWLFPGTDLYKGNGRVKHEYYNIQQGPFQNIQIHSYQSNDNHSSSTKLDYALGGNNHFDIHVFRNNRVTGDVMPLETFTMQDIANDYSYDDSKLVSEQLKQNILPEFLNLVRDRTVSSNLDLHTYANTILLMSSVYESSRRLNVGINPIVNVPFLYDISNLPPLIQPLLLIC